MSREVRRVPVGWAHPVEPNPYRLEQSARRRWRDEPESALHSTDERFIGLMDDYPGRLADWQQELADTQARRGHRWTFGVKYHLTGYQGREDDAPKVHPFWTDDVATDVRDEDRLHELLVAEVEGERPHPADYMPVFGQPTDTLGWCLYETVSQGTPVTPVFATADELIDHLATVGQDWAQQPMRRSAAEVLVRQVSSFGSFIVVRGQLLDGAEDADRIATTFGAST